MLWPTLIEYKNGERKNKREKVLFLLTDGSGSSSCNTNFNFNSIRLFDCMLHLMLTTESGGSEHRIHPPKTCAL